MTQQQAPEAARPALPGDTEAEVERVFAEILQVPSLPRTASLFDLGLDSMWVTIACARLEQITGVRVRFTQIFRTPTIAQLAAWIDAARDRPGGEPAGPVEPVTGRLDELVAVTPVQAETVPQKIVVEFAWWFGDTIDEAALESAATDIHRRHQALHARYLSGPDLGLAEVPADPGRAEFHRLSEHDGDDAAIAALRQALREPLDVGQGQIWRCATVRSRESGRTLFGLAVDHSGFDGHSWGILTAELAAAYAARVAGRAPQWPLRTASLAEVSCDFRHQLAAADVEAQRRYWRDELSGLPACKLPERGDGQSHVPPMPADSRYSVAGPATLRDFLVPQTRLQVWDDYARAHGMPPSVGMAAIYVESIVRAGAAPDFGVVVPIANNSGELIDGTITNRVGNIVLRPNGPSGSGPGILSRTRDAYLRAMAARDVLIVPEELGTALSGDDKLLHLDRLVALNYNATPELSLGGAAGELLAEGGGVLDMVSHFAVMLIVSPAPDGLDLGLQVRTDMHDAALADEIKQHLLDIIDAGPDELEGKSD